MIVQCEHCQTKYRISDEKVKGKAAKVRCAKCNNTFTILPVGATPAAGDPTGKIPPVSQPAPPVKEPSKPPLPEMDSEPKPEPGLPPLSPQQPEAVRAAESPTAPDAGSQDLIETPLGGLESDLGGLESGDLPESLQATSKSPPSPDDTGTARSHRPAHEIDRSAHTPSIGDDVPLPESEEFEVESTSRTDMPELQRTSAEPSVKGFPGALPSADEEMGWGNISLGSEPDKQIDEGGLGLAGGSGYRPPPIFDEELPESAPPDPESMPVRQSAAAYRPESAEPKKSRKGLLILFILAVLGAGGYFAYPRVMEIIGSKGVQSVGTLTPDKIQVRSLSREDGSLIYTVRGVVRNDSIGGVGMIQVEAQFRNTSGTIVAKSTAYCGNIFEDKDLISGDLGKTLTDLQNELGQSLSNSGIQPGQVVPFLIVLENPPPDVSKVTVTISGFKETT